MTFVNGVNLLPATGEFTYGTVARLGRRVTEPSPAGVNFYHDGSPPVCDIKYALDQLQTQFPACQTVAIICAWFGSSTDASTCQIYPSTTYIGGTFQKRDGSAWVYEPWRCSSLTQSSAGLIPISSSGGIFSYGGTPSDQSIVECIAELKARGLRVVFYPFILMDNEGKSWRGRITYSPDVSSAAASAVSSFLGTASPSDFTRNIPDKTVDYAGSPSDYTYRRMILHYAHLCVVAGGVDLFIIGSELRSLETIRGPAWTNAGTADGSGKAVWDYPFVQGLIDLSDDVRSIFDAAGLTKDTAGLHNLISYAADWSSWVGYSHAGSNPASPNGQWPHLDRLWAHANIDLVCFDNYLPLSDWTSGAGGLDVLNWAKPSLRAEYLDYGRASDPVSGSMDLGCASEAASSQGKDYGLASVSAPAWPPDPSAMSGLGLSGTPTLYSKDYLKANIEGGERFHWFYFDSTNLGRGLDPLGSGEQVSLPQGDRATQSRNPYYPGQEILGHKQLRWWWNHTHKALYDDGLGGGVIAHGPDTQWVPQSKPIVFTEYGYPSADKCTNQPNLFFDASSTESGTPFWSRWEPAQGTGWRPKQDQQLQLLALQAFHEYWFQEGHNAVSVAGVRMIEPAFCSVWNWDARPFPVFPYLASAWGDAGNWQAGNWLNGKGPFIPIPSPDPIPGFPMPFTFPSLPGLAWSVHKKPSFSTRVANHVSGREVRAPFYSQTLYEFELTIEGMDSGGEHAGLGLQSLQSLMGLYLQCQGQYGTFIFTDSSDYHATLEALGFTDGVTTDFVLLRHIGDAVEPVSWATVIYNVYIDGVLQPGSSYQLVAPNILRFTGAPGAPAKLHSSDTSTNPKIAQFAPTHTGSAGDSFTFQIYAKAAELTACRIGIHDGTAGFDGLGNGASFNLASGSFGSADTGVTASITSAGGGWYLLSVKKTLAGPALYCRILLEDPFGTWGYAASGDKGAYLSGAKTKVNNDPFDPVSIGSIGTTARATLTGGLNAGQITVDFDYAFLCRFLEDQVDFDQFMNGLWKVESLKFRSVKP
ncbi:MAG TPA: glycoside hydrolase TIM-barrel-like domain-containing protein [Methylocella sp.]|nr:glycoside hydrolase TIM-barrel-like domain-containing protein [Methylocella sp.]